jgi:hypothetical protein
MDLGALVFNKKHNMGKYYENLDDLIQLVKKVEKKHLLAEFLLECILLTKITPAKSTHEIIKEAKKKWFK